MPAIRSRTADGSGPCDDCRLMDALDIFETKNDTVYLVAVGKLIECQHVYDAAKYLDYRGVLRAESGAISPATRFRLNLVILAPAQPVLSVVSQAFPAPPQMQA